MVAETLPPVCFAFSSSARFWPMILAETCVRKVSAFVKSALDDDPRSETTSTRPGPIEGE